MTIMGRLCLALQRYEAKYLINEVQAAEIVRYCRDYLHPDPHTPLNGGEQYPVLSTYLDSPTRILLRQTLEKQSRRFKLRVRRYHHCEETDYDGPSFFEVKWRKGSVVHKTRLAVPSGQCEAVLRNGGFVPPHSRSETLDTGADFFRLRSRLGADPLVGVFYMRTAFESKSIERVRVTLDRDLRYGSLSAPNGGARDMWWPVRSEGVVLEIKFTNTYPSWIAQAIRRLEIMRRGVCKYVVCARAAGISAFGGPVAGKLYA